MGNQQYMDYDRKNIIFITFDIFRYSIGEMCAICILEIYR